MQFTLALQIGPLKEPSNLLLLCLHLPTDLGRFTLQYLLQFPIDLGLKQPAKDRLTLAGVRHQKVTELTLRQHHHLAKLIDTQSSQLLNLSRHLSRFFRFQQPFCITIYLPQLRLTLMACTPLPARLGPILTRRASNPIGLLC